MLKRAIFREAGGRSRPQAQRHRQLLMRQQLFCNSSVSQAMFELTNALLEAGHDVVAQREHSIFAGGYIREEEELYRRGSPEKHARVSKALTTDFDAESAITLHFGLLKSSLQNARYASFPNQFGRDLLYTTGNHTVSAEDLRQLGEVFDGVVAPSRHVMQPYFNAGLSPWRGAVIPHGIDPAVFAPGCCPVSYPTGKGFKFLQTSFPWVYDKGFDVTITAFCRAFSGRDDAALIFRIPRVLTSRTASTDRLLALVEGEAAKRGAPEVRVIEGDVEQSRRGGVYTGADCYVHPLRPEGFGMTILEPLACGLPVIATPWSGPADFLAPRYSYGLRHSGPVPERARDGSIRRFHVEPEG